MTPACHAPEEQYSAGLAPAFMSTVMATRRLASIVLLCIPVMLLSIEIAAAQKPTGQSPPTLIVTPSTSFALRQARWSAAAEITCLMITEDTCWTTAAAACWGSEGQ